MNLIELINSVVNSLNTREMAIIILLITFLIILFLIKNTRNAVFDLIGILFSAKKIIIPFIGMTLYISLILYLLYLIGLFNVNLIKDAIFWFLVGAIPLFFKANDVNKKYKNFFRNNAIEFITLSSILSFLFINFYTFNITIELILISTLVVIVLLIAVSKTDEKYKPTEKFFSIIFSILVIYLILNFAYNLFTNPNGFININTGITYILPAILTITLMPYIYALALYIEYDTFYLRLRAVIKDSKTRKYVFKKVFMRYNLHFFGLTAFLSEFRIYNIHNNEDIEKEILKAEKRVTNKNLTNFINTSNSSLSTFNSTYRIFENKFVNFTSPGDLKIKDKSTDTELNVMIYDNDELLGQIISATITAKNMEWMISVSNEIIKIAGQNAASYSNDIAIGADIFIDDNNKGDKMTINIDFDPAFPGAYNLIKNTLIIKQNP
jgi:hypothetical protein